MGVCLSNRLKRIVDDGIRFRDLRLRDCSNALKRAVSLKLGIESDDVVNYGTHGDRRCNRATNVPNGMLRSDRRPCKPVEIAFRTLSGSMVRVLVAPPRARATLRASSVRFGGPR